MNNAPFSIGQKVVALRDSSNSVGDKIIKGKVYAVSDLRQCACGKWKVNLGMVGKISSAKYQCSSCGLYFIHSSFNSWACSEHLAPTQTQYADATSEILEKFPVTEGGEVDKILNPEKTTA